MSKGLKALSRIESFVGYNYCSTDLPNEMSTITKELKALEIIKNKSVNTYYLKKANNVDEYNDGLLRIKTETVCYIINFMNLTQEEFEFLKEVFENE